MLEQRREIVAILFADICESTPLYADNTDDVALELIEECLDAGAAIVSEEGGRVVRSKGDDLLCTFQHVHAAIRAARRMVARQSAKPVKIRIGVHYGDTINARDDVFGDAVNVTARVLALGRPNEVLATSTAREQLREPDRHDLLSFGRHFLKGRSDPIELYKVTDDDGAGAGVATIFGPSSTTKINTPRRVASTLALTYMGRRLTCSEGSPPIVMGRLDGCDFVVSDPRVSRRHAKVVMHGGKATLIDHSTRGTWVSATGGEIFLHRESLFLVGKGCISLVGNIDAHRPSVIEFELIEPDRSVRA